MPDILEQLRQDLLHTPVFLEDGLTKEEPKEIAQLTLYPHATQVLIQMLKTHAERIKTSGLFISRDKLVEVTGLHPRQYRSFIKSICKSLFHVVKMGAPRRPMIVKPSISLMEYMGDAYTEEQLRFLMEEMAQVNVKSTVEMPTLKKRFVRSNGGSVIS